MAESRKSGPRNPPFGICRVPARSPGILGYNDAADPNQFSLLGDTPGPLGSNDYASPALLRLVGGSLFSPGTPLRLADGTSVSAGPARQMPVATTSAAPLITVAVLKAAHAGNSDTYYAGIADALNKYATAYAVNTNLRIAHFLAQIGHESGFKVIEENGNYSAKRMREIFGCKGGAKNYDKAKDDCKLGQLRTKLWSDEITYANHARNLLSYAYASRMGNGNESSGDGYKFRGRGMIQLTGKDNYAAFTKTHNAKNPDDVRDFVANPDLLVTATDYGIESAFYFWNAHGGNAIADTDNVIELTRAINGGDNGLPDREARVKRLKKALGI